MDNWAHKKWNKIASDVKLVFHSSNIKFYARLTNKVQRNDNLNFCAIWRNFVDTGDIKLQIFIRTINS